MPKAQKKVVKSKQVLKITKEAGFDPWLKDNMKGNKTDKKTTVKDIRKKPNSKKKQVKTKSRKTANKATVKNN